MEAVPRGPCVRGVVPNVAPLHEIRGSILVPQRRVCDVVSQAAEASRKARRNVRLHESRHGAEVVVAVHNMMKVNAHLEAMVGNIAYRSGMDALVACDIELAHPRRFVCKSLQVWLKRAPLAKNRRHNLQIRNCEDLPMTHA